MGYQQVTLSTLLQQLKDSWESAPFWTDAEGIRAINHALRTWNLLTGMWKQRALVATTAGSHYVTLPAALTYGMQVSWGPTGRALSLGSIHTMDLARPRWEEETTATGGGVPTTPRVWGPSGLLELFIWPADSVGGNHLVIDGVAATPVLANLTDYVDMGSQDSTIIAKYALRVESFKRGALAMQGTQVYFADFLQAAARQNDRFRLSSYYRKFMGLDADRGFRPIVRGGGQLQPGGGGQ